MNDLIFILTDQEKIFKFVVNKKLIKIFLMSLLLNKKMIQTIIRIRMLGQGVCFPMMEIYFVLTRLPEIRDIEMSVFDKIKELIEIDLE